MQRSLQIGASGESALQLDLGESLSALAIEQAAHPLPVVLSTQSPQLKLIATDAGYRLNREDGPVPVALLKAAPLNGKGAHPVFVPPVEGTQIERQAWEKLNQKSRTLWLAPGKSPLGLVAPPGAATLVCPRFPQVALAALSSARFVVSADATIALACLALKVPVVTYGRLDLSASWGVPCVSPENVETAESLALQIDWEAVDRKIQTERGRLASELFLDAAPIAATVPSLLQICCVADSQYVGFLFGLIENLRQVHPGELKVHVLGVDAPSRGLIENEYSGVPGLQIYFYSLDDIWNPEELALLKKQPVSIQAFTSKPRILLKARQNGGHAPVYLVDLDMYFHRSPARLVGQFDKGQVLLFPQRSDVFAWARFHGIFNSGLVGTLPGAETFLAWWSRVCLHFCRFDSAKGYFGDQVFLDVGLWYFRNAQIYRDHDEDVAAWSQKTLDLKLSATPSSALRLPDGRPVGSFHAAGPDALGIFELKNAWDQVACFFSSLPNPDALRPLLENTLLQQGPHWPELQRFLDTRALLQARLGWSKGKVSIDEVSAALTPQGQRKLGWWRGAQRVYRWFRGNPEVMTAPFEEEDRLWVEIQKAAFFDAGSFQPGARDGDKPLSA